MSWSLAEAQILWDSREGLGSPGGQRAMGGGPWGPSKGHVLRVEARPTGNTVRPFMGAGGCKQEAPHPLPMPFLPPCLLPVSRLLSRHSRAPTLCSSSRRSCGYELSRSPLPSSWHLCILSNSLVLLLPLSSLEDSSYSAGAGPLSEGLLSCKPVCEVKLLSTHSRPRFLGKRTHFMTTVLHEAPVTHMTAEGGTWGCRCRKSPSPVRKHAERAHHPSCDQVHLHPPA